MLRKRRCETWKIVSQGGISVRESNRAERLYEAANNIQSAIDKLMTFGAFSSDMHRERDKVSA